MVTPLSFRLPSRTAWRSALSAAAVALFVYWRGARGFGAVSFLALVLLLYALASRFSEWRGVRYSFLALAVMAAAFFAPAVAGGTDVSVLFSGAARAFAAGALALLLFVSAAPRGDHRRIARRIFGTALPFFSSLAFFLNPGFLSFTGFVAALALLVRDEAREWETLRVGSGKLVSAAVGLVGAEVAAFAALLPLGPTRAAVFVALVFLMVREGVGAAYRGWLRPALAFQGIAAFFAFSVLIFSSVSWTP
ncbi:MAG: hypothetical protein HYU81_02155 [Candidatus Brennerbacteria bacterium]|nr:hypothetical protein [Candidatus Brennerbacteria bacterium]